ncbi:MAG: short-subunit dehydrogenase [Halieaceae bacterium]|jgi:short-subunit dehydrogenase
MSSNSFKDKTVIITGASAGVGAACASLFAKHGAKLVLAARGEDALNSFADTLRGHTEVMTVAMDVANEAACTNLIEASVAKFGAIHVLINNAGLHHRGNFDSQTPENMVQMVDVNLRAPIFLTGLVLPYIRKAGGGAVVMVGSLAGRAPLQGASTYASTKAGIRAFAHSLVDELIGTGIHVGVVSPGPIDTGFIMDSIDEVEDIVYSQRMSSAEEVADAVLAIAEGKEVEISLPASGGLLTTLSYLLPALRRKLRPALYAKGRKNKEKYRSRAKTE